MVVAGEVGTTTTIAEGDHSEHLAMCSTERHAEDVPCSETSQFIHLPVEVRTPLDLPDIHDDLSGSYSPHYSQSGRKTNLSGSSICLRDLSHQFTSDRVDEEYGASFGMAEIE